MPDAIVPRDAHGNINFTSEVDPTTGRVANDGECKMSELFWVVSDSEGSYRF
jgi:hypothetical protein